MIQKKMKVAMMLCLSLMAGALPTFASTADTLAVQVDTMSWDDGVAVSIPVDQPTAVKNVTRKQQAQKDSLYTYDLQGRRAVRRVVRGIYIRNGRKYVRR